MENYIKVRLPGETPWAEVLQVKGDLFLGRIANRLFSELSQNEQNMLFPNGSESDLLKLHNYKQDDELWFIKDEDGYWIPFQDAKNFKSNGALN